MKVATFSLLSGFLFVWGIISISMKKRQRKTKSKVYWAVMSQRRVSRRLLWKFSLLLWSFEIFFLMSYESIIPRTELSLLATNFYNLAVGSGVAWTSLKLHSQWERRKSYSLIPAIKWISQEKYCKFALEIARSSCPSEPRKHKKCIFGLSPLHSRLRWIKGARFEIYTTFPLSRRQTVSRHQQKSKTRKIGTRKRFPSEKLLGKLKVQQN